MRTKIIVNNFAKIESGTVYLDDFLLFVGDNNSGKTLLMELMYSIVELMRKWEADCSNVKMTETEYVKYIRFDQEWYKDIEKRINSYLKENKEKFIIDNFKNMIPLEKVFIEFEEYEDFFYIATIATKVSLEKQYSNGNREIVFEDLPVSDDIGKKIQGNDKENKYFDFSVSCKMSGSQNIQYEVYATKINVGNELDSKYVKMYLTDSTSDIPLNGYTGVVPLYSELKDSSIANDSKQLYVGEFHNTGTQSIRLRMWLSDAYQITSDAKEFKIKVNVLAKN